MKYRSLALITGRIAFGAVLLFSCLTASAQVKVQRSIFHASRSTEPMPTFIQHLEDSPGAAAIPNEDFGYSSSTLQPRGLAPFGAQDSVEDSLRIQGSAAAKDTALATKSPGLAMLLSAIVPGTGQIYVHRYITIPLIWGFGYYFTSAWITQNNNYKQYRELFTQSIDSTGKGNDVYQKFRDIYRDDRDRFALYIAITYVLNIIDAYVGASLYSFDVSDNLGGSAALRIRIPIR